MKSSRSTDLPIRWLACPVTGAPLSPVGDELHAGGRRYHRHPVHGFWQLLPEGLPALESSEWRTWEALQANGMVSYQADPEKNLGVGPRNDFLEFAEFCDFQGLVLDVGVGPQRCPTHIGHAQGAGVQFVGLDPLEGDQPKPFPFVQGVAEYLPFRSGLFDQVLFVTTLDHFIDPRGALRQARRVLREGGSILVWLGEKAANAPRPARSHAWYETLQVPEGAADRFHFRRFGIDDFGGYLNDVGLRAKDRAIHEVDQWRRNMFYRLVPE